MSCGEVFFMGETILTVIAAVLAVFGLYCLCRLISALIFSPSCIAAAVIVSGEEDAENLSENLGQAATALFRTRTKKIIVIIPESLMYGCMGEHEELYDEYREIIENYGAEWIIGSGGQKFTEKEDRKQKS